MVKKCAEEGCNIVPNFNEPTEIKGLYCTIHKKENMVDVKNKKCIEEGCNKVPNFNEPTETKGIYCKEHKKENMVNVIDKKCIEEGCNKTCPIYNFPTETKGLYCKNHKKANMVNVRSKRCIEEGCDKLNPVFNLPTETKGIYCATHKKENMVNITRKSCKLEYCSTIPYLKKYDGYCLFCYIHMFPDKPVSQNYKTKEFAVVEYVKTKFPNVTWIADKSIQDGCSKKRPDLVLDLGYQILIVEIDENQHTDYDCSCENKRIMELSQDLGHRPIVFIRFNPDDYIKQDTNISSCWGYNQNGICVVKKSKQKEWTEKLESLEDQINYWMNNNSNIIFTINEFNKNNIYLIDSMNEQ